MVRGNPRADPPFDFDLSDIRKYRAPYYTSVDPELMIPMLVAGYCFGIRSERRLCEEAHLNLAYLALGHRT